LARGELRLINLGNVLKGEWLTIKKRERAGNPFCGHARCAVQANGFPGPKAARPWDGLIFLSEIGYSARTGPLAGIFGLYAFMACATDIAAFSAPLRSERHGSVAPELLLSLLLLSGPWAA
jgi:hypothetical protein